MSKKSLTGVILTVVGSLVIGVLAGLVFLNLFKSQMPAAAVSQMTNVVSPVAFVATGVGFGLVIALWTLVCAWLTKRFGTTKA